MLLVDDSIVRKPLIFLIILLEYLVVGSGGWSDDYSYYQQHQQQQQQQHQLEQQHHHRSNLPYRNTVPCYSCMSKLYEAVWPSLSHIYMAPQNFTDDCNDDRIAEGRVPIVRCSTICLSLFEQPNIAGIRIKGYIRGCMNGVLKKGFNMTVVNRYRWLHRDSCRPYRKRELFELGEHQTDDSTIDVCTCYADHCNGNTSPSLFVSPLLVFTTVLVWQLF